MDALPPGESSGAVAERGNGGNGGQWSAVIPAQYTDSAFPLQYYFELQQGASARLHPGLGANQMQCPYFVVRQG